MAERVYTVFGAVKDGKLYTGLSEMNNPTFAMTTDLKDINSANDFWWERTLERMQAVIKRCTYLDGFKPIQLTIKESFEING